MIFFNKNYSVPIDKTSRDWYSPIIEVLLSPTYRKDE